MPESTPRDQSAQVEPTHTPQQGPGPTNPSDCGDPFEGEVVQFSTSFWDKTDFCQHSVPYVEIISGGPPPDGIPAIDSPKFESTAAADEWLGDAWPVMAFELNGEVRAYPLAILMWHEIVNDVVGGDPVAVTFCPLCNSTIVFSRELPDGTVVDFGTSGNLRNSDLVMYDRQTESWWQQLTGEAIVGRYTGTQLEFLPSQIIGWSAFKERYPDAVVLSRDTGARRDYGRNPYAGYDSTTSPFLFRGEPDGRLPPVERVVAVTVNGVDAAYPFSALQETSVANDNIGGVPIVVFWKTGTNSALDASNFSASQDIGSTSVFERTLDGQVLTFQPSGEDLFTDLETGSLWNIFGEAVEGPLEGASLTPVVAGEHFWFAWAAFKPDTTVWAPGG